MGVDWSDLLLAYLHDPPDKALSVRGHVPRARDNAQIAVGEHVSRKVIEEAVSEADPLASIIERLPMPSAGPNGERAVGQENGRLQVVHPLSATKNELTVPDSNTVADCESQQLHQLVKDFWVDEQQPENERQQMYYRRFLAIWRLWPERLTEHCHPCFSRLPADTRTPDHTIWHHLDVTAAFKATESRGHGAALLAFALGPVQRFIEASRSVRDLWSGSMILSWLTFRAILPIIEQFGPTALIYPTLRGNPLLDLWLRDHRQLGDKVPLPRDDLRRTPALPHRFLAVVPWSKDGAFAKDLACQCREAVNKAWGEMAQAVRDRIRGTMASYCPNWDKRWQSQTGNYFSTVTAVLPLSGSSDEIDRRLARLLAGKEAFQEAFPNAEAVRAMARAIPTNHRPSYDQDHAGRWQYQVELVQRSLAAQRTIRHVPPNPRVHATAQFPQKCTLLGSYEQIGPDDLRQSKDFWDQLAAPNGLNVDGVRIRQGEALCAVALVKRFAGPAFLAKELSIEPADLRFPDTWTVAAAEWLNQAKIDLNEIRRAHGDWNGHWLHWRRPNEDLTDANECPPDVFARIQEARNKRGQPPVYYAVLKLDGDDLGGWLRGEKSPKVREVMHPALVSYYEGLGEQARVGLDARRPVGPALHAAISTALANFALDVVPEIVRMHHGTTIYSGGDDTLVLLPACQALPCVYELRQGFTSDFYKKSGREYLMMGSRATISGGLVIVHAKDDLRLALQDARRAEDQAKEAGKNALTITIRRRSGEHTSVVCPWDLVPRVRQWSEQFRSGASDRWAYHLYMERSSLAGLSQEGMHAEMRRQIMRAEEPTPRMLPPDDLIKAFNQYSNLLRFDTAGNALSHFLTLCLTASFLARGRDR